MKKEYEEPIIEVIKLDNEDCIIASTEAELEFPGGWIKP